MADTLEQMIAKLNDLKKRYKETKAYYEDESSWSGKTINVAEQLLLDFIEYNIGRLEEEIEKRKRILEHIDIDGVKDYISSLYNNVGRTITAVGLDMKEWHSNILTISTYYVNAFERFEKSVKAQGEYQNSLDNIGASAFSIMSTGIISWASTAVQVANVVKASAEAVANVLEDMVQAFSDKAISAAAPKLSSKIDFSPKAPLVFKNELMQDAIKKSSVVIEQLLNTQKYLSAFEFKLIDMSNQGIGNENGSEEAIRFYKAYLDIDTDIKKIIQSIEGWKRSSNLRVDKSLEEDFERAFWAKWILRLKKHIEEKPRNLNPHTLDEGGPAHDVYTNISWSDEVQKDLHRLINLDSIGVGQNGLGWSTMNDIKLLCNWAEEYIKKSKK